MLSKSVTVTMDQRFKCSDNSYGIDSIVASKGDVLKVERHIMIRKGEYIVLPKMCTPNKILLESALSDGWVKVNN